MDSPFQKTELLDELDGDREFLEESLDMFDQAAPDLLARIRDAVAQGDAEAVRIGAHTLKSMVGNFSAKPAFEAASHIETVGRNGDLTLCTDRLATLETEVARLQKALRELLNELR